MPFYEYECQACKYYTEVMQKITDAPLTRCPSCGKRALRKLVSAPVFRLKGGGWYETDFKSDKENKRNLLAAEKEEPKPEASQGTRRSQGPRRARTRSPRRKDGKESKDVRGQRRRRRRQAQPAAKAARRSARRSRERRRPGRARVAAARAVAGARAAKGARRRRR